MTSYTQPNFDQTAGPCGIAADIFSMKFHSLNAKYIPINSDSNKSILIIFELDENEIEVYISLFLLLNSRKKVGNH